MRKWQVLAGSLLLAASLTACAKNQNLALTTPSVETEAVPTTPGIESEASQNEENSEGTRIRLTSGDYEAVVVLYENATAQELQAMLPVTLAFEYYNSAERIAYPPEALVTEGVEAGVEPKAGDLALYIPWGNIAVFCEDFRYSDQLIPIGKVESGQEVFNNLEGEMEFLAELQE